MRKQARRRGSGSGGWPLERWQTLLAALVAAVASIIVAFVSVQQNSSPSPDPTTLPVPISSILPSSTIPKKLASGPIIGIRSWTERPTPPPPGKRYTFKGIVNNKPDRAFIVVLAQQQPSPSAGATHSPRWLISPLATVADDGTWTVVWHLPRPPADVRWTAVVLDYGECPGPGACGGNPFSDLEGAGPKGWAVTAATTVGPGQP
jgi:hypothetical protein